jgi:hypothetical protein
LYFRPLENPMHTALSPGKHELLTCPDSVARCTTQWMIRAHPNSNVHECVTPSCCFHIAKRKVTGHEHEGDLIHAYIVGLPFNVISCSQLYNTTVSARLTIQAIPEKTTPLHHRIDSTTISTDMNRRQANISREPRNASNTRAPWLVNNMCPPAWHNVHIP